MQDPHDFQAPRTDSMVMRTLADHPAARLLQDGLPMGRAARQMQAFDKGDGFMSISKQQSVVVKG